MMRIDSNGNVIIWFQMYTDPRYKIELPLEEWLLVAKESKTVANYREAMLKGGEVRKMSNAEINELGVRALKIAGAIE